MAEIDLYIGNKATGITVFPDSEWPNMWRIKNKEGRVSDMVNLTRAKDAAISWCRPRPGPTEVLRWRNRETGAEPSRIAPNEGAGTSGKV